MRPSELLSELLGHALSHPALSLALTAVLLLALRAAHGKFYPQWLPGPAEYPIIGALPWLLQHRQDVLGAILAACRAAAFRTWTVKWLGSPRYIMTTDPRNLEHVLKGNFANYPKGALFNGTLEDLLGGGIFVSDGEQWKAQRHLFASLFTERSFNTVVLAALHAHGGALEAALARAAAARAPIDLFHLHNRFTLDTIGSIAFGLDIGSLANPAHPFAAAFDQAQQALDLRFFTPGWRALRSLLPSERRLAASVATMHGFCAELIAARRAEAPQARAARTDVLSRAMALEVPEGSGRFPFRDSDAALRDLILNFLIAGRDTTAQALSWAVLAVCSAQRTPAEVGERLAAEGARLRAAPRSVSTSASADAGAQPAFAPSYEALEKELPYASAVMRETLRLFPSVPKDIKTALQADVLPDGTYVPAGATLAYLPYAMGRSPALWGEDCEAFVPERFLGKPLPSAWKLPAFNGAGPRTCLGQRMALAEANFVLALIFSRFRRASGGG
jgi:cytochrome P450